MALAKGAGEVFAKEGEGGGGPSGAGRGVVEKTGGVMIGGASPRGDPCKRRREKTKRAPGDRREAPEGAKRRLGAFKRRPENVMRRRQVLKNRLLNLGARGHRGKSRPGEFMGLPMTFMKRSARAR